MIATAASEIWATPTTITGSIGVFGIIPTLENSLESLGIHSDGVGTTVLADFYRLDRPMSDQAKAIVQQSVENIYERFLRLVSDARNSSPENIHAIAQGRVWTGEKAKEIGLVDNLGSMKDAIAAAARLAGTSDYNVRTIKPPLSFQEQLIEALSKSEVSITAMNLTRQWLPQSWVWPLQSTSKSIEQALQLFSKLNDPRGLYLQCYECADQ
ncbi:MAG: S49 family peptidase [Porticoccaceae bacterium]